MEPETVLACGVVNNVSGRARAWVRIALNMKALEASLKALLKHHRPVRHTRGAVSQWKANGNAAEWMGWFGWKTHSETKTHRHTLMRRDPIPFLMNVTDRTHPHVPQLLEVFYKPRASLLLCPEGSLILLALIATLEAFDFTLRPSHALDTGTYVRP
jgi:hypothetical protein